MAAGRILRAGAGVCLPAAPPAARFVRRRLAQSGQFPHEIGLFLGYPPCDVLGFLHDAGRHSKLSGYWQVYGDAQAALALFAKYKKCADVYARCHANGTSIWQLTVAA